MAASGCRAGHSQPKTCYLCSSPVGILTRGTRRRGIKEPTEGFSLAPHDPTRPVCQKGKTLQWSFPLWKHSKELQTAHSRCSYFYYFFNLKRGLELPAGFTPNILELFLS